MSALRLSEKGYSVGILESGKRFADGDYAKSVWDVRKYLWAPFVGCRGILQMTPFRDVFVMSGVAVGGGSTVYANTLYRAKLSYMGHTVMENRNGLVVKAAASHATGKAEREVAADLLSDLTGMKKRTVGADKIMTRQASWPIVAP